MWIQREVFRGTRFLWWGVFPSCAGLPAMVGRAYEGPGRKRKTLNKKSMDCMWCPLKVINRQKMKGQAYTCELDSARVLASRGSGSGCFLFLWPCLGPHPWGKSFTEQLGGGQFQGGGGGSRETWGFACPSPHFFCRLFRQENDSSRWPPIEQEGNMWVVENTLENQENMEGGILEHWNPSLYS